MFCQNRKVEPKRGFKCFKYLKHYNNFGYGGRKKWIQKWFYHMRGEKNRKNGLQKCLPPFVIPTVQNLSFCQVPKKWVIQNCCRSKTLQSIFKKWQLGLEVVGLQLKMPYHVLKLSSVEKRKKKVLLQSESQFVWVKKYTVQNGSESITWWQSLLLEAGRRGRKEEGIVDIGEVVSIWRGRLRRVGFSAGALF